MKQQLTIGMATYDDWDGVFFTIQNLRLQDYDLMSRVKFVIVDNHPNSPSSAAIASLLGWLGVGHQYIPMDSPTGTSAPRNKVFEAANTEWVMCVDSHVLLVPNALRRMFDYIDSNPQSNDLLSGPILKDDLTVMATHFDDVWRGGMWGIWGLDHRGINTDSPPFEIPAMGLGLFCCRKEAWNKVGGFHPRARGFGGEEFYIHKKFYRAGYACLCLPFLKWLHRFAQQSIRVPYPASNWNKARNYVMELDELGLPLDVVYAEFVSTGLVPMNEWLQLVATPSNPPELPAGITPEYVNARLGKDPVVNVGSQLSIEQHTQSSGLPPINGADLIPVSPGRFRLVLHREGTVNNGIEPVIQPVNTQQSPGMLQKLWNASKAAVDFVSDGLTLVSKDEYERRLSICDACEHRDDTACSLCGCNLSLKAAGRAFECPINKWNQVNQTQLVEVQ